MLAERFNWPPDLVDSLPQDYIDELVIMFQVRREVADEKRKADEREKEKTAHLNRMRAKNNLILSKQRLRPQA